MAGVKRAQFLPLQLLLLQRSGVECDSRLRAWLGVHKEKRAEVKAKATLVDCKRPARASAF